VGLLLLDGGHGAMPTRAVWTPANYSAVVLSPGMTAFAQLQWSAVPGPGEQGSCAPAPAYVEITPPDETTQLTAPWTLEGVCQQGRIDVLPLALGAGPPY
jgi:hypothetical protein